MSFLEIYIIGLGAIVLFMTAVWLISVWITNASIVDMVWGITYIIAAIVYFMLTENGYDTRKWLILILTVIWGGRLSLHITIRNWGKGEDFRYQRFRERYGAQRYWWFSFFQVFLLQGLIAWIVSLPLLAAQYHDTPAYLTVFDVLGVVVWGIGLFFEAVGDWQLSRFKANPENKGKVLNTGLWKYTRHPNYFGDSMVWWGLFLLALSTSGGVLTIVSPILMTYLLLRVSGVLMLERALKHKPGYEEYIRRTSAFFPMPPKK
ncbi:MAG: DUF1295 domain-containing protein [Phototrophicales bacterium]